MKAAVLTGIRKMELREVPDPGPLGATDVLIRMGAVGVCGSDVHYYTRGRIGSQVVRHPFTAGHEGAGIVAEVGSAVTALERGDRVAIDPAMPCWRCDQCGAGRHHTCRNLRFLGCPGESEGCLAEYVVMPETSCWKVPEGMTLVEAALSEPLSIGVYAVKKSICMKRGATSEAARVGVLGTGPIGLGVILEAAFQGAGEVYATDKIAERLDAARHAGACWAGNPDREDVAASITRLQPAGLDVVFECCGEQDAIDDAIEILKPGGKLMVIGIPSVERVSFSVDASRRKEICIQHVRRQVDCVGETLERIHRKDVSVDLLVTHRFALEKAADAFDLVAGYRDGVIKAMIEFPCKIAADGPSNTAQEGDCPGTG